MNFPACIKRLSGKGIITTAAKHNLREFVAEMGATNRIDPARTPMNYVLRGPETAKGVATLRTTLMRDSSVKKLRVDAIQGLEVLFTWPFPAVKCPPQYFEDCTEWAVNHFRVPILSSVVHLDESEPHCHVLLLPLVNGRMNGSNLFGHAYRLAMHLSAFYDEVGTKHGIERPVPRARLNAKARNHVIAQVHSILAALGDLTHQTIALLLEPHRKNPHSLIQHFKLLPPAKPSVTNPTFVEMMTKKMKPEKANFQGARMAF